MKTRSTMLAGSVLGVFALTAWAMPASAAGTTVWANLEPVAINGVDHNHDGKYSGDTKSDLDPKLPTEATDPALCGALWPAQMAEMPAGGVQTGGGSTSGVEDAGLMTLGGLALVAGAAVLIARRRSANGEN